MTDQVDVLEMSSEEFEKVNIDHLLSETVDETPEEDTLPVEGEYQGEEEVDDGEYYEEGEEEEVVSEEETTPSNDYGFTFSVDGSDISLNSREEVEQYLHASQQHYRDAQAYNQSRDMIRALRDNGIDESKLAFAIDLLNGDTKAINELVKDIDIMDILEEEEYVPRTIATPAPVRNMEDVLQSLQSSPHYQRTVETAGKQWDSASLDHFRNNPNALITLNEHIGNGIFDNVTAEIKKRRMMGQIPSHLPDYQVYDMVGQNMYAQPQPQYEQQQAPIRTPSRDDVVRHKQSMSTPRSRPSVSREPVNALEMSTEEFEAYKRKHPKLFR